MSNTAAVVTIHRASEMTTEGRNRIARWLESRAKLLRKHANLMAKRFVSVYSYTKSRRK